MRVFLIGFMGAGKSYWGSRLANILRLPFIDTDIVLAKYLSRNIPEIFATYGEEFFRQQERELLQRIPISKENFICATGGGMSIYKDNLTLMQNLGITIFLDCNPKILYARVINNLSARPLLSQKAQNLQELSSWIETELMHRRIYYLQAKHIIQADNIRIQQILALLPK